MTTTRKVILALAGLGTIMVLYYGVWMWGICRTYVDAGRSLLVVRKTGELASSDGYAGEGQRGVMEQLRGPGRHFFNPWVYDTTPVADVIVKPGQVGVVTAKVGENLPDGRFLADPDQKGVQRQVLTPGAWRLNPHGMLVEALPATIIEPGYVGVQTRLGFDGDRAKGIMAEVLQPGYHHLNPRGIKVDSIEIGYRELTLRTELGRDGTPIADTGVSFPTKDGFRMYIDLTVVWGLLPENAPRIIREYGNIAEVEDKIINPQIDSICKLNGSRYTVREFIVGDDREKFQQALIEEMQRLGKDKGIEFLLVLVRGIYPPDEVRERIQSAKLAEEESLTLEVRKVTDEVAASLEEAIKEVEITVQDFTAETRKLVASEQAKGKRKAAEIEAETGRLVAEFEAEAAKVDAQITLLIGRADADVVEAQRNADADRFRQQVAAFGGGEIYSLAQFAESLPADLRLEYRYSGPGTFWTDPGRGDARPASGDMVETAARVLLSHLPPEFWEKEAARQTRR